MPVDEASKTAKAEHVSQVDQAARDSATYATVLSIVQSHRQPQWPVIVVPALTGSSSGRRILSDVFSA